MWRHGHLAQFADEAGCVVTLVGAERDTTRRAWRLTVDHADRCLSFRRAARLSEMRLDDEATLFSISAWPMKQSSPAGRCLCDRAWRPGRSCFRAWRWPAFRRGNSARHCALAAAGRRQGTPKQPFRCDRPATRAFVEPFELAIEPDEHVVNNGFNRPEGVRPRHSLLKVDIGEQRSRACIRSVHPTLSTWSRNGIIFETACQ